MGESSVEGKNYHKMKTSDMKTLKVANLPDKLCLRFVKINTFYTAYG